MPTPKGNPKETVLPDNYGSGNGDGSMDECVCSLLTSQLMQTGNVAQNNFVTVAKFADYDFMENKRMVTLDEAVGVREVSSKKVPAGPTTVES